MGSAGVSASIIGPALQRATISAGSIKILKEPSMSELIVSGAPVEKQKEKKPDLPLYHTEETAKIAEDRSKERTGTIKAQVSDVDPGRIAPPVVPGAVVKHVPVTVHDVVAVPRYGTKDVEYQNGTPILEESHFDQGSSVANKEQPTEEDKEN